MQKIVLVDKNNSPLGYEDKMKAHKLGLLHRAFSILIYNSKKEILIQKRSKYKYHTPSLWTNTCCSHPKPNESYSVATSRRLNEEMGISCKLDRIYSFVYNAKLDNNLIEHEYDTVFIGQTNSQPAINFNEASDYRYISFDDLRLEIANLPYLFTPWFKIIIDKMDKNFFESKNFFFSS